jgi:hypothetical protein
MNIGMFHNIVCIRLKVVIQRLAGNIAKRRSNPQLPDSVMAETA